MKKQEIMKNTADQRLIPFTDDLMFALVMRDTEICREFLRLILPEEKLKSLRRKIHYSANAKMQKTLRYTKVKEEINLPQSHKRR